MAALAFPAVLAQVSQMSMGFVDTFMVAQLGPEALGAVGVGNVVYFFYTVFSFGTLAAVSPMVAQAYGAGNKREIGRAVGQGLWLAAGLAAIGIAIAWNADSLLILAGQKRDVAELAVSYTSAMSLGLLANLWFAVLRFFCDAVSRTRVAMTIAFVAVFVNITFDYLLIYGKFGFPALGPAGAGYATAIVQWSMFGLIAFYVLRSSEFRRYRFVQNARRLRPKQIAKIVRLGAPIGVTHSMEHGFFGVTSLLMGTISTVALAAHQASIILAALAFMVPLGTSFAITARVGQAIGRGDRRGAALAGWVGIGMGTLFMCTTATVFFAIPETLASIIPHESGLVTYAKELAMLAGTFPVADGVRNVALGLIVPFKLGGHLTGGSDVASYAAGLLVLAGAFQISDGIQVLSIGALRGMKDTTRPMITNLISYWLIGLPCGWLLAFEFDLEGRGLWWGLVIGLSIAAALHTLRFRKLVGHTAVSSRQSIVSSGV